MAKAPKEQDQKFNKTLKRILETPPKPHDSNKREKSLNKKDSQQVKKWSWRGSRKGMVAFDGFGYQKSAMHLMHGQSDCWKL